MATNTPVEVRQGTPVMVEVRFVDSKGFPDPPAANTVTLTWCDATGEDPTTWLAGTDEEIVVNPNGWQFSAEIPTTSGEPGVWTAQWFGPGVAKDSKTFTVLAAALS